MNPIYNSGDVVFFKNVKLYRHGRKPMLDTRINGHPFVVLNNVNDLDEYALCLNCSSSDLSKADKQRYVIKNISLVGYPAKETTVDLKHVYKIKVTSNTPPSGRIPIVQLSELKSLVEPLF